MALEIRPARSKKDVRAFVKLPYELYRNDPLWTASAADSAGSSARTIRKQRMLSFRQPRTGCSRGAWKRYPGPWASRTTT
jgi:hypothetical protein